MTKEVLAEAVVEPKIADKNLPEKKLKDNSNNTNKVVSSDDNFIQSYDRSILPYSDFYEEMDDLERNEDRFAPITD